MRRFKVYLAGPIAGLNYDDAQEWRSWVKSKLAPFGIDGYSPLRQKQYLKGVGKIEDVGKDCYSSYTPLATDGAIMTRDHNDCQTADLIFCNLLGAERVSIGTVLEIGWAFAYRKPLIMLIEPSGNPHEHPMIREGIGFRYDNLLDAIDATKSILLP